MKSLWRQDTSAKTMHTSSDKKRGQKMEITLTDVDGIQFQVHTDLIQEYRRRGEHSEAIFCDDSKINVRETPIEFIRKILKAGANYDIQNRQSC